MTTTTTKELKVTSNWEPNSKQRKILSFLKANPDSAYTLKEISKEVGFEVKSSVTNTLVTKGLMVCNRNAREIVCECCGHKSKVSTYSAVKGA